MAKVLLTGASGFVGRHIYTCLKEQGYEVVGICNKSRLPELMQFDLFDTHFKRFIKDFKADYLIHAAWFVGQDYKDATENLEWLSASLDIVKTFYESGGKRVMTLGSCFEYGKNILCRDIDSSAGFLSDFLPDTLYGTTKLALYNTLKKYTDVNKLSYVHPRLFYLFGPHESPNRLVPSTVIKLLTNQPVEFTSLNYMRDFLYIEDAAEIIVTILGYPGVTGVINVGSGQETSTKTVTKFIEIYLNKVDKIKYTSIYNSEESARIVADVNKLNREVGPQFKYTFEGGLAKTLEWIKENYKEVK